MTSADHIASPAQAGAQHRSAPQLGPGLRRGGDGALRRLLIILLAALVMRALVLGDPVVHVDEEFYFTTARAMTHGALPYVDIWDRKPIGLFLLYLPAAAFGWPAGIYAYQALAFASAVATAWAIARLADRAGWQRGATLAAVAYLIWLDLLGGVGGQAPVFFNLLTVAAASLAMRDRPGLVRGVAAMALIGVALQVKYSAVFEGVALGLWLLWRGWKGWPAVAAQAMLLATIALLPTIAAWGYYQAIGQGPAFVYANFTSIFARVSDPLGEQLGNAGTLILILSPLVAMAFGAAPGRSLERRFLQGWLAVAVAGVALFGSWFDHYGLPILVPACACAAGFFANPRWRRLGPATLALAAVIGLARVAIDMTNHGTARQFVALAAAVGRGPGCLYVYSGSTMLYPATGRCTLGSRVFPSHLTRIREAQAVGVDQATEVRRILAAAPAVIVMRPPYRGERAEIRAIAVSAVRARYRLAARLPMGRETWEVWRR